MNIEKVMSSIETFMKTDGEKVEIIQKKDLAEYRLYRSFESGLYFVIGYRIFKNGKIETFLEE